MEVVWLMPDRALQSHLSTCDSRPAEPPTQSASTAVGGKKPVKPGKAVKVAMTCEILA